MLFQKIERKQKLHKTKLATINSKPILQHSD